MLHTATTGNAMFNSHILHCCQRHGKIMALATGVLLITACSANRLAYNNLDWLIGWKVDDYVSLTGDQKSWLARRTDEHLAWHCDSELPQYLPVLDGLEASLLTDNLEADTLTGKLPAVENAVDQLLGEIAPTISGLLSQLDDRQIQELSSNLEKKQAELEEKYGEPDLTTQYRERMERAQERLEDWLGPLEDEQYARLADWAAQLQGHNSIWLENRQAWQLAFTAVLEERKRPGFDQQVLQLLIEREDYWTAEYRRIADRNREEGARLAADLMQLATAGQRTHLSEKIDRLRADIIALQCSMT